MGTLIALLMLTVTAAALLGSYAYYHRHVRSQRGDAETPAGDGAAAAIGGTSEPTEPPPPSRLATEQAETSEGAAEFYLCRARAHLHAALHADSEQESAHHLYAAQTAVEEGRADPDADDALLRAFDIESEMQLAADRAAGARVGAAFDPGGHRAALGDESQSDDEAHLVSGNTEAMLALLDYYKAEGASCYEWVVRRDCCESCRRYACTGPFAIDAGIAGAAPVPWRDSHAGCRCTLIAVGVR